MNASVCTHQDRAYLRHPSEMPIHIHCASHKGRSLRRLSNVSVGGLACRSEEPIPVGSEVSVEIPIGREPFKAKGAVRWCRHAYSCYELGIQFEAREDTFAVRMVEQLCYIERYRREVLKKEGREIDSATAAIEWIGLYAATFPQIS